MQIEERIKKFVDAYFEGSDGFLVDIKKGRGDKIQVFIDTMGKNISIDVCAYFFCWFKISKGISFTDIDIFIILAVNVLVATCRPFSF